MSFYPPKINERFAEPRRAGRLEAANAVGTRASFVCGAGLRFRLLIENGAIVEAKFQTNGCGYLVAAADVLAEITTGKQLTELGGLENLTSSVAARLGSFSADRERCANLAVEALQAALNHFRSAKLEEWRGEKALICSCFGVSEEEIERVVRENGCETVAEVSSFVRAGLGCGSCQPLIQEIIDSISV